MKTTTKTQQILREEALYGKALTFSDRCQIADLYDRGRLLTPGYELWVRLVIIENREWTALPRFAALRSILRKHEKLVAQENVCLESYDASISNTERTLTN
jgi:hypothetical protein